MRLHRLVIEAFGPFAGREAIDLDMATESGLFLITGPTGSGKTSVLDAVSFALFGAIPGARGHKQLRSQHAAREATPTVELEITLRGRRFRITRSPSFERPGRKTPVQASVTLAERIDGTWAHLTGRLDECGRILEDVLGMTAEQFYRVVLLPQGDFASFLHASNDERGALLRRLFDVDTFADVESWLAEERRRLVAETRDADRDLQRVRESVTRVLAHAPAAMRLGDDDTAIADLPADELVDLLAQADAAAQSLVTEAMTAADTADGVHRAAEASLARARAVAADHDRGTAARERHHALLGRADAQAERVHRLDAAHRADRALAHEGALRRAADHLASARADDDQAARSVPAEVAGRDLDGVTSWIATLEAGDGDIRDIEAECRGLVDARRSLPGHDASVEQASMALAEIATAREELAARGTRLTDQLAEIVAAETAVADLARGAGDLAALLAARSELDALQSEEIPGARTRLLDARDLAQELRSTHQDLVRARLDDMAGELAERLVEGEACLVCGSVDHPVPATREASVDDSAIDEAEACWLSQTDLVDEAQQALTRLESQAGELARRLEEEHRSAEELLAAAEQVADDVSAARATAAARPEVEAAIEDHRRRETELVDREQRTTASLHRSQALADAARTQTGTGTARLRHLVDSHRSACPCAGPGGATGSADDTTDSRAPELTAELTDPSTDAVISLVERAETTVGDHVHLLRSSVRMAEARRALARAADQEADARQSLSEALDAEGFADLEAARRSVLDPAEQARTAQAVAEHDQDLAVSAQTLAEPEVQSALACERPDLDSLTAALGAARTTWQSAERAHSAVEHAARAIAEHHEQARELVSAALPLEQRREMVADLADLATGRGEDNPDGISLTTYVLAVRLERIVALANERLRTMADGRYELAVDHGRSNRRSRGGLGLQVLDQWTGAYRPATTLSGGETFMVALALALGTADAVREESGGVDLQTLFIDEGFGSLDDEALEQVMSVLDELRSGGRAVGVISHVADMRQRIPTQLAITKTSTGSTVEMRTDVDDAA